MEPETGTTTYSGKNLNGRPTASGEPFDSKSLTAAHPSYPLGSLVRVTNTTTLKSVIVRINDRVQPDPKRVIQLSKRASDVLELVPGPRGTEVTIEPLKKKQ